MHFLKADQFAYFIQIFLIYFVADKLKVKLKKHIEMSNYILF